MQSGNDVGTITLEKIALDADGCLFSAMKYSLLLLRVLDKHWDFFEPLFAEKSSQLDLQSAAKISAIIAEFKKFVYPSKRPDLKHVIAKYLTNEKFRARIRKEYATVNLNSKTKVNIVSVALSMLAEDVQKLNSLDPKFMQAIFIKANEELFDFLATELSHDSIAGFDVALWTNRQTYVHEKAGMDQNGTDAFHKNIYQAHEFLHERNPHVPSQVNTFTLGDIYADFGQEISEGKRRRSEFQRGYGHQKILAALDALNTKTLIEMSALTSTSKSIYDESKFSILYAVAHDMRIHLLQDLKIDAKNKRVLYRINIVENEMPILQNLIAMLQRTKELLPEDMTVNFFYYDGYLARTPVDSLTGTGKVDYNYAQNVRLIAKLSGHDLIDFGMTINAAEKLDVEKFLRDREIKLDASISNASHAVLYQAPQDLTHKPVTKLKHGQESQEKLAPSFSLGSPKE